MILQIIGIYFVIGIIIVMLINHKEKDKLDFLNLVDFFFAILCAILWPWVIYIYFFVYQKE